MKYRIALVAILFSAATAVAQTGDNPWGSCCGGSPWPNGGMMDGWGQRGGMMGGSMQRRHYAMMSGIPTAYRALANPLPRTRDTVEKGRTVYEQNCAMCHGATGAGDGPTARDLSPPPANLALLSLMPMAQWDSYMYWTVSDGGTQFGTAMPAFKNSLSKKERWAVIAYIQARFPEKSHLTKP